MLAVQGREGVITTQVLGSLGVCVCARASAYVFFVGQLSCPDDFVVAQVLLSIGWFTGSAMCHFIVGMDGWMDGAPDVCELMGADCVDARLKLHL
ncbi:hypothetical protein F4778DRAFT_725053 [Xylariomycetidae sp. FL2044]|nr:hypothetical protein F4778DRAFT_725053 [Xylariomycetidae sp. FL2044]